MIATTPRTSRQDEVPVARPRESGAAFEGAEAIGAARPVPPERPEEPPCAPSARPGGKLELKGLPYRIVLGCSHSDDE